MAAKENVIVRLANLRFDPRAGIWSRAARMGLLMGLGFGVFDLIILLLLITGGRYHACSNRSYSGTCDWLLLALTYPAGAGAMGAILGAALPAFRRLWLAIPFGILATIPWFAGIAVADVRARAHWQESDTLLVLGCATAFGSAVGYIIWKTPKARGRRSSVAPERD